MFIEQNNYINWNPDFLLNHENYKLGPIYYRHKDYVMIFTTTDYTKNQQSVYSFIVRGWTIGNKGRGLCYFCSDNCELKICLSPDKKNHISLCFPIEMWETSQSMIVKKNDSLFIINDNRISYNKCYVYS